MRRAERSPAIEIADRYRPRSDCAFLREVARAALRFGRRSYGVSMLLTGEREIASIHGKFLGKRSGTDVISFLIEGTVELVVSVERARWEAGRRGHAIKDELALYVVHGILHACGYEDGSGEERRRMREAERRVLEGVGVEVGDV